MTFNLRTASGEAKAQFPDDVGFSLVSQYKVRIETVNLYKDEPTTGFIFEKACIWESMGGVVIYIWKGDFLYHKED